MKRLCIIDADSILYRAAARFSDKDKNSIEDLDFMELEELSEEISQWLNNFIFSIIWENTMFDLYIACIGGDNNFRKLIYPQYKAGRPPKPYTFDLVRQIFEKEFICFISHGAEAEDACYSYWLKYKDDYEVIIAGIDKDLLQFPAVFFNYNKQSVIEPTPYQCLYNACSFLIKGDITDNIKVCYGDGEVWCKNNFTGKSKFGILRAVISRYKHHYKSKAMEKLRLIKELTLLKKINVDSIPSEFLN